MKGLLSMIIAVAIIVVSSIILADAISFLMEDVREFNDFNQVKESMTKLDSVVRSLLFEAEGATKSFNINIKQGTFYVNEVRNTIYVDFESEAVDPGTNIVEGTLIIEKGPFVSAYEGDVNNDGVIDYILENNAMLFSTRRAGNATSLVTVNTTDIITSLRNKKSQFNSVPSVTIFIDSVNMSSGNGYTRMSGRGSKLKSSSIILLVNSSDVVYEAEFTLTGGHDFVELEINEVSG